MDVISEVETAAQALFKAFCKAPLTPELEKVKSYLFPSGMTPVIQLEENGRKKRSSASLDNWNPQSGEIRIFLEPAGIAKKDESPLPQVSAEANSISSSSPSKACGSHATNTSPLGVSPEEVVECCQALAIAEKSNRQFISLKWFRDSYLPTVDFAWARSSGDRQRVLSYAIELGRIDAKKIPNPKSEFPTMTVALNRSMPIPGVAPRFQPIAVRGEPVSTTLLRDRGSV